MKCNRQTAGYLVELCLPSGLGFLLQAKIPLPVTFLTVSIKQCLKPCWSSFHNFQKNLFYWFNQYKKLLKGLCYNLTFLYFFWFTKNIFSFVPCKHSSSDKTIPNFNFFPEIKSLSLYSAFSFVLSFDCLHPSWKDTQHLTHQICWDSRAGEESRKEDYFVPLRD